MAKYYFRNVGTSWNVATNWSTTSGGSGDGQVPGTNDDAEFDANSGNCTQDVNNDFVNSLTTTSGYTGTLTIASSLFCDGGGCTLNGGTISVSSDKFLRAGDAGFVVGSGATLTGDGLVILRKATAGTATYNYSGTFGCDVAIDRDSADWTLQFSGATTFEKYFKDTGNGSSSLTIDGNDQNITFKGDVDININGGTVSWSAGNGTITFSGDTTQEVNFNGEETEAWDIDTTGTVQLTGAVDPDNITITAGTLDVNGQSVETTNMTVALGARVTD